MAFEEAADVAAARRRTEIRARRGTPERLAAIELLQSTRAAASTGASKGSSGRKTPENSDQIFGHPWSRWFQMRDVGYQYLADQAVKRTRAPYGELWEAISKGVDEDLGNHWRQLPNLLGYIGDLSYEKIHLVVTALVIYNEGDEHPGPGFFRLAASHGLMPMDEAPPLGSDRNWPGMSPYQSTFWNAHCEELFTYFAASN